MPRKPKNEQIANMAAIYKKLTGKDFEFWAEWNAGDQYAQIADEFRRYVGSTSRVDALMAIPNSEVPDEEGDVRNDGFKKRTVNLRGAHQELVEGVKRIRADVAQQKADLKIDGASERVRTAKSKSTGAGITLKDKKAAVAKMKGPDKDAAKAELETLKNANADAKAELKVAKAELKAKQKEEKRLNKVLYKALNYHTDSFNRKRGELGDSSAAMVEWLIRYGAENGKFPDSYMRAIEDLNAGRDPLARLSEGPTVYKTEDGNRAADPVYAKVGDPPDDGVVVDPVGPAHMEGAARGAAEGEPEYAVIPERYRGADDPVVSFDEDDEYDDGYVEPPANGPAASQSYWGSVGYYFNEAIDYIKGFGEQIGNAIEGIRDAYQKGDSVTDAINRASEFVGQIFNAVNLKAPKMSETSDHRLNCRCEGGHATGLSLMMFLEAGETVLNCNLRQDEQGVALRGAPLADYLWQTLAMIDSDVEYELNLSQTGCTNPQVLDPSSKESFQTFLYGHEPEPGETFDEMVDAWQKRLTDAVEQENEYDLVPEEPEGSADVTVGRAAKAADGIIPDVDNENPAYDSTARDVVVKNETYESAPARDQPGDNPAYDDKDRGSTVGGGAPEAP